MKIRWIQSVELEIFINYDEDEDQGETDTVSFAVGDEGEVDIIGGGEGIVDMQFGDGSVALTVSRELFEEIP